MRLQPLASERIQVRNDKLVMSTVIPQIFNAESQVSCKSTDIHSTIIIHIGQYEL